MKEKSELACRGVMQIQKKKINRKNLLENYSQKKEVQLVNKHLENYST